MVGLDHEAGNPAWKIDDGLKIGQASVRVELFTFVGELTNELS